MDRNVGSGFRRFMAFENLATLVLFKGPFPLLAYEFELRIAFFGTESADPASLEFVVLFEACALVIGSDVLQTAFVQLFCVLI